MGRASRRKHERRVVDPARPRWAGALGFDRAYRLSERYIAAHRDLQSASEDERTNTEQVIARARSASTVLSFVSDHASRKVATLEALLGAMGHPPDKDREPAPPSHKPEHEDVAQYLPYSTAMSALAVDHLRHLQVATPITFDPLGVPEPTVDAIHGLGLPFPVVVVDFLAPSGLSMPVVSCGDSGYWVGLVAATIAQGEPGGPIDVWPIVTTLRSDRDDDRQVPREMMFGHVRFGGPLPPPPDGLTLVEFDDAFAWVMALDETGHGADHWAELWARTPALAAVSALRLLDAVNVTLEDVTLSRPERRRAEREGARPALTVDIRTSAGTRSDGDHASVDWQHRWTVRGHWKHFGEDTSVARRHPSRVIDVPGRGKCARVWCPPHVKGPADKPLVLKTRRVAALEAVN